MEPEKNTNHTGFSYIDENANYEIDVTIKLSSGKTSVIKTWSQPVA